LVDTSNQIVKQRTQINKINQNLQSLQKQIRAGERQTGTVNQNTFPGKPDSKMDISTS
jgi:hypothetical protein